MNIKVGQWVRNSDNSFYQLDRFCDCAKCNERGFNGPMLENEFHNKHEWITTQEDWNLFQNKNDIKVADTPQELVQVGDLVYVDSFLNEFLEVQYISKDGYPMARVRTSSGSEGINLMKRSDFIKAIYTKDSEGNYIKQWEKTND